MIELQPITYSEACEFIKNHHRHHLPPQGWKYGIAANDGEKIVGVVTVGRPAARHLDDSWTLEVTRCCSDGTKNVCSKLYAAAWRAARALGFKRMVTYTLASEHGSSLKASGWKCLYKTQGGSWECKRRKRVYVGNTDQKLLWETDW